MPPERPPKDNIVRANRPGIEVRASTVDGSIGTLTGHFSVFNAWYEVDSVWEGHFLERVAPGAFKKTFAENRDQIKVTFNHGQDPQLGDKVLGPIVELREDETGAYYEVPLLDTSFNRDLLPGLKAGVYGASFRFRVMKEEFNQKPGASDYNPEGLPERTIKETAVGEFGPVTFPASASASASVRSLTDVYVMREFSRDPARMAELIRDTALSSDGADASHSDEGAAATQPPEPVIEPDTDPPPPAAATQPEDPADAGSLDSRSTTVPDITTIEDKRSRVTELKDALARQAIAYPGVMPDDEQIRFDADDTELVALERDVAAWDSRQATLERHGAKPENQERAFTVPNVAPPKPSEADLYSFERSRASSFEGRQQEYRDHAMRINEVTRYADLNETADESRTRDRIADILDNHDSDDKEFARRMKATGSPAYRRAFEKIVKGRGTMFLTPEEQRGTALAVGVDGTGGFAVPFAFDPTVIAIGVNGGAVNPYRATCRVVPIVGTDTWNALTATAVVATRTTEAAAAVEQGPTFAQPQYIVKRVQGQITLSVEMGQDRPDLLSEMGKLIQEAKDNEEETSWATGAGAGTASIGVGPVNGTSGAYTSITTATSVTLAAADADATEAALPVRHRFNAQWFLNRQSIRRFQTLETAGGKLFGGNQYQAVGNPALSPAGNTGLRLLGYPVNESPSLPTAQTANIVIGTLLNPDSYVIVDRVGMSIQFIPFILNSSSLVTGQQAIYFLYRNHAAPINVDAGRTLRYLT